MIPVRRGPRPKGSNTRSDIQNAAVGLFAENGYSKVSLRMVARTAGVDPTLVSYYFGTKENLFRECLRPEFDDLAWSGVVDSMHPATLGVELTAAFVDWLGGGDTTPQMTGLLSAAVACPEERSFINDLLLERLLLPVARRWSPDEPELRAALSVAVLIGVVTSERTLHFGPLREAPDERLVAACAPLLQLLLLGDLPPVPVVADEPVAAEPVPRP